MGCGLREVPIQGVHTNNFVESWHRNLNYNFMSRTKAPRPDKFLHGLVFDVEPSFRQAVHATQLGFASQTTTKFQGIAKGQADTYSQADLEDIGVHIFSVTSQMVSPMAELPLWVVDTASLLRKASHRLPHKPPRVDLHCAVNSAVGWYGGHGEQLHLSLLLPHPLYL